MEDLKSAYREHSNKILKPFKGIQEVTHFLANHSQLSNQDLSNLFDSVIKKYSQAELIKNFTVIVQGYKFIVKMKEGLTIYDLNDEAEILCFLMAHSKFEKKLEFVKLFCNKSVKAAKNLHHNQINEILKIWDLIKILSRKLEFEHKVFTDQILGKFIEVFDVSLIRNYKVEFLYFIKKAPGSFVNILLNLTKRVLRNLNIAHYLSTNDPKLNEFIERLKTLQKVNREVEIPESFYNYVITPYTLPNIKCEKKIDESTKVEILLHMHIITMPGNKKKNVYQAKIENREIVVIQMEGDYKSNDYKVFKKEIQRVPKLIGAVLTSHRNHNSLKLYLEKFEHCNYFGTDLIIDSIQDLLKTLKSMNESRYFLPIITYKSLGVVNKNKIVFVDFSFLIDEKYCNITQRLVLVKTKKLRDYLKGLVDNFDLQNYGKKVNIETLQCNSLGLVLNRFALGYIKNVKSPCQLSQDFMNLIENLKNRTATISEVIEQLPPENTESIPFPNN